MDRKWMNERKSPDQAYFCSENKRPNSLPTADGREKSDFRCLWDVVAREVESRVAVEYARRKEHTVVIG